MPRFGMTTFGKLGPSAEGYLQSSADFACSTGAVGCVVWGRRIVFRHFYQSMDQNAGKDLRDGAAVPFE